MEYIKLVLDLRIRSENNLHGNWRAHASRAKAQRSAVYDALSVPGMSFEKNDLSYARVALTRIAPRQLDGDNLQGALKAVRDGTTDWMSGGLNKSNLKDGVNDRDPRIYWHYAQARGQPKEYAVYISVEWEAGVVAFLEEKYNHLSIDTAVIIEAYMCLKCLQVSKLLRGQIGSPMCDHCGQSFNQVWKEEQNGNSYGAEELQASLRKRAEAENIPNQS